MAEDTVSLTTRIGRKQYARLLDVCGATGSEVSRSEIVRLALELFLAQLEVCPSMIPGYDPALDRSARQKRRPQRRKPQCGTEV